ncbi:MAG: hypothetical protein U1E40_03085 [Amaricoccus sp.]
MPQTLEAAPARNLFGAPRPGELFAAVDPESTGGREMLAKIARKIGDTRRPGAQSDIPAGATYLAQFVAHDLDFPTRDAGPAGSLLDLGLIYGDGPKHDAYAYQVPSGPGAGRHLLRVGRTRPTATSPAWGAARDLPRTSCPNLDARPAETRSEVLVPNSFSDSNLLLGQMQVLWALMHNAIAGRLAETRNHDLAFDLACRVNRGIYREVIRHDLLGNWLMPRFRQRYATGRPRPLAGAPIFGTPREFMAGVGRLGHGLVREIYALNDQMPVTGLRDLIRQTSTGRPHDMPLTEDWLVDFANFFAIGASVPQRTRALGPHVARPFATGLGAATDGSADPLVLRDLVACTRAGIRSVRSLIARATEAEPRLFDGCFAQEEATWIRAVSDWLADTGIEPAEACRIASDPPLTLFLMLEAEADTAGRSLGALGSVIMGETIAAALPAEDTDPELRAASAAVFRDGPPASMADMIRFLQRRYRFAEGARLHPSDQAASGAPHPLSGGNPMLDFQNVAKPLIPRIEVADYIEMGRMVAQWATEPASRPRDVGELKEQLDGIAVVPDRIETIEFVQSTLDHLVLRLPVKEMIEESLERMSDPIADGRYPLPQFYADHYRPGFGPVMTPLDTLLARVGDYTIAQCR